MTLNTGENSSRNSQKGDAVFFQGTISRITYRNADTGFAVIKADHDETELYASSDLTTIVGLLPESLDVGSCFIARGEWQVHPKFGRQFRAWSITETTPTGKDAIFRYLASGTIKGFGPVLAQRVVDLFGEDTLKIIDETPEKLREVPGIGKKKLEEILASWEQKRSNRDVILFFQNHGLPMGLAQRIYQHYGARAIELTKENPYRLCKEIWGIGFQTADRIAQALGTDPRSQERLIAGIVHSLEQATDEGHCYLPQELLTVKAQKLLALDNTDGIREAVTQAMLRTDIVQDNNLIYLPYLHLAEMQLAWNIARKLQRNEPEIPISSWLVEEAWNKAQVVTNSAPGSHENVRVIHLSDQQKEAVALAANKTLLVITGGPGCGKTTIVRTITQLYKRAQLRVGLAAPTGRAAQRLAEVCESPASTIHRLLKYDPNTRTFEYDDQKQLPFDALIIDESSMIDLPLAASLLKAIPAGARVVIVGDADQLPSVGPGLFLADMLQLGQVPRIRLTTLFRRSDESRITEIAHEINKGLVPDIPQPDGQVKSDAYFLRADDAESAAALIERLAVEQVPKKFNFQGPDIIVLSPMNQGPLGIIALNQRLQEKLVPKVPGTPSLAVGNLEFRLGDRVCQRVNNYSIHSAGVFNGDQGHIVGIDHEEKTLYVELWDKRLIKYSSEDIYQLDLAYALTIHRAQGSEVPVVILALHDSHHIMLERQLIYTGVTRAKKLLLIVGTKKALTIASKRSRSKDRFTLLADRVRKLQPRSSEETK